MRTANDEVESDCLPLNLNKLSKAFGKRLLLQETANKMFFLLVTSVGQRKILSPHEESNLRPSDLRSDALPLSHKDSSVSGVYYEVLMTRVLHTARISNVDSVMFLTEIAQW